MGMFSGKTGDQSSASKSSSSKDSIQKQINAEQARIGKGNWNQTLNDLVKQRDNPASSGGIASIGSAMKNAGSNIARDVKMGFSPSSRDADYYRRTAETIARTQGADAANRYISQMGKQGGVAAAGVKNASVADAVKYGQRVGMLNADGSVNNKYMNSDSGGTAATNAAAPEEDQTDAFAENMRRYQEFMQGQNALTVAPQQPTVTPDMRRAALSMFESQQGAGQVPYYMAAARNAQNPNMSPAFQYAAQNYDVLGGSQRLGPRPMEMMSVAERGQINDMAQAMANQQAAQNQYQQGMDMVLRGGGKGGPRTGPQMPQGQPMMPQTGGGMPRPPLPFASMLASRFGRMY